MAGDDYVTIQGVHLHNVHYRLGYLLSPHGDPLSAVWIARLDCLDRPGLDDIGRNVTVRIRASAAARLGWG